MLKGGTQAALVPHTCISSHVGVSSQHLCSTGLLASFLQKADFPGLSAIYAICIVAHAASYRRWCKRRMQAEHGS